MHTCNTDVEAFKCLQRYSSSRMGLCTKHKYVGFKEDKSVLLTWWCPLGRLKACCSVRTNMSLGVAWEFASHTISSCHSLLHAEGWGCEFLVSCFRGRVWNLLPCHLHGDLALLWTMSQTKLFHEVTWTSFITARDKALIQIHKVLIPDELFHITEENREINKGYLIF